MATRTLYLVTFRMDSRQRRHFSVFVPSMGTDGVVEHRNGTLIQVVGAPMAGYLHQIEHKYNPQDQNDLLQVVPIEEASIDRITGAAMTTEGAEEDALQKRLKDIALSVAPPRISRNFLGPVDGIENRRCQEWTMEYLERLVSMGYISGEALEVVQSHRDPPDHGVGLKPWASNST